MKMIIFWEIILVIATVPVFRALWILLDSIDWFNRPVGVLVSFVFGIMLAGWSFKMIRTKLKSNK